MKMHRIFCVLLIISCNALRASDDEAPTKSSRNALISRAQQIKSCAHKQQWTSPLNLALANFLPTMPIDCCNIITDYASAPRDIPYKMELPLNDGTYLVSKIIKPVRESYTDGKSATRRLIHCNHKGKPKYSFKEQYNPGPCLNLIQLSDDIIFQARPHFLSEFGERTSVPAQFIHIKQPDYAITRAAMLYEEGAHILLPLMHNRVIDRIREYRELGNYRDTLNVVDLSNNQYQIIRSLQLNPDTIKQLQLPWRQNNLDDYRVRFATIIPMDADHIAALCYVRIPVNTTIPHLERFDNEENRYFDRTYNIVVWNVNEELPKQTIPVQHCDDDSTLYKNNFLNYSHALAYLKNRRQFAIDIGKEGILSSATRIIALYDEQRKKQHDNNSPRHITTQSIEPIVSLIPYADDQLMIVQSKYDPLIRFYDLDSENVIFSIDCRQQVQQLSKPLQSYTYHGCHYTPIQCKNGALIVSWLGNINDDNAEGTMIFDPSLLPCKVPSSEETSQAHDDHTITIHDNPQSTESGYWQSVMNFGSMLPAIGYLWSNGSRHRAH